MTSFTVALSASLQHCAAQFDSDLSGAPADPYLTLVFIWVGEMKTASQVKTTAK